MPDTFQDTETRQRYLDFMDADGEVMLMDISLYKEHPYQMASVRRDKALFRLLQCWDFRGVWTFE